MHPMKNSTKFNPNLSFDMQYGCSTRIVGGGSIHSEHAANRPIVPTHDQYRLSTQIRNKPIMQYTVSIYRAVE